MPLSEYVVKLPAGHREGTGDAEEVDPLVLEVELGVTIGEVRLGGSLELDKLDEVADWVCSVLDEDVDMDMVEESTGLLDELVSIVELVSVAELDPIEELGVEEVDDDDSLVDDDSPMIDELGERVAVIVMEEESSRNSELTLDVLAPDSLDNNDDVEMTEVLPMPLDADEDDGEILADCELLSVEDRDNALLKPGDWLDDVVP